MQKTVTTLTLHDLQFLKNVVAAIRDLEDGYTAAPDPLYDLGKTLGPKIFDTAYKDAVEAGFTEQTAYLVKLLEGMPDLTTYSSYINSSVMAAIGQPAGNLTTALFDGAWMSTMMEYVDMVCPCEYVKVITYEGGPRPETPPPVTPPTPEQGTAHVMLSISFDHNEYRLHGNLLYHHLDGPLPYFDDFIGGLFKEVDPSVTYSMGDFLLETGEYCHNKRVEDWRLDESTVINPYMKQYSIFIKDDSSVAYNTPGTLSSSLWLNDWTEYNGKVHSPLTMPFEDWFVIYHKVPHSSLTDIMTRASTTISTTKSAVEYVWYPPAATPAPWSM